MQSGIMEYLISPFTSSFSCMIKIRIKFIPNIMPSMSLLRPPRYKTTEHCCTRRKTLISLCQLRRGMKV